jgi:hypothetical protein
MTYTEVIDGEEKEVVVQDPIPATHEEVSQAREKAYADLVDHLHLRKIRKTVLGEWTEELEAEYVAQVTELSAKVKELHPYPEDLIEQPVEVEEHATDDIEEVANEEPTKE